MANDERGERLAALRPQFEAIRGRHENGTAPRPVLAFNLFQTPPELARRLVALLPAPEPGGRYLEPSAGLGRLLDALALAGWASGVAIEQATECQAELYRQEREGVRLVGGDFLGIGPDVLAPVDAVAMNPPFKMRRDIAHTLHALQFLKPGGVLAGLCLDTEHRERALRPLAATWEKIPAGAFSREGTGVATILFSIIKKD